MGLPNTDYKDKNIILISSDRWENRAVVLEKGRLVEFYAERKNSKILVNAIYLGRIKGYNPSLKSYFVDIGLDKSAFLSCSSQPVVPRVEKGLNKGDEILVQLVKPPYKTKGAKVSFSISLPGHYLVYFPWAKEKFINVSRKIEPETADLFKAKLSELISENCGIIVRTAALDTDYEMVMKEYLYLREKWENIKHLAQKKSPPALIYNDDCFSVRVIREVYRKDVEAVFIDDDNLYEEANKYAEKFLPECTEKIVLYTKDKPLFEAFNIEYKLSEIFSRTISLPSGGYIVIDRLEALTVIDVNSGSFSEDCGHEEMALKVNLEAATEAVRQIRLRNLSGIILIDFVDIRREESKEKLLNLFDELIQNDRAFITYEFVPTLTMFIITRKHMANVSASFIEEECETCKGSGWVVSKSALAVSLLRKIYKAAKAKDAKAVVFRVNEEVLKAVAQEFRESLPEMEKGLKKAIYLLGSEEVAGDGFEIVLVGEEEIIKKHFHKKIMFTK